MTFFDKIQSLRIDQSPFDRRWKMAKLVIDTAGAGPAEHPFLIPFLDANFVVDEQMILKREAAIHQLEVV